MAQLSLTTDAPESGFPWEAVIGLAPHLIWAAVLILVIRWIGVNGLRDALKRISKVGVAGLELEFREELEAAVEAHGNPAPPGAIGRASRRLAASADLAREARILWVDDEPQNNAPERHLLESSGARITLARSTTEALAAIKDGRYDLIISDIRRGEEAKAGLGMSREFIARGEKAPVIFYVGEAQKPAPTEAFGIADRPDELIHLVLDALARRRC